MGSVSPTFGEAERPSPTPQERHGETENADDPHPRTPHLADARVVAAAAEAEARANGWAVSIAICDAGGHALWLQSGMTAHR